MHPNALLELCADLIGAVNKLDAPADAIVSAFFRQHKNLGQRERASLAETVYALLRERLKFQNLAQSGSGPMHRRLAMLAWRGSDSFLRAALSPAEQRWLEQIQAIAADSLAPKLRHNMPDWLAEPLQARLGEDEFWRLAGALNEAAPLDLRVNTLKLKREEVQAELQAAGIEAVPTPYSPWGLRVQGKPALNKLALFTNGSIEVQDEGSQLLALLLAPKRGEMVVDFCAGAGGKTLALAAELKRLHAGTGSTFFVLQQQEIRQLAYWDRLTGLPWAPAGYELTGPDGTRWQLDAQGRVTLRITPAAGCSLTPSPDHVEVGSAAGFTVVLDTATQIDVLRMAAPPGTMDDDVPHWAFVYNDWNPYAGIDAYAVYGADYQNGDTALNTIVHTGWLNDPPPEVRLWFACDGLAGWWWLVGLVANPESPSGYDLRFAFGGTTSRRYPSDQIKGLCARYGLWDAWGDWNPAYALDTDGNRNGGPWTGTWSPFGEGWSNNGQRHAASVFPKMAVPQFPNRDGGITACVLGEFNEILILTDGYAIEEAPGLAQVAAELPVGDEARRAHPGFEVEEHRDVPADELGAGDALYEADGAPKAVGTRLRNPAFARTLRTLAEGTTLVVQTVPLSPEESANNTKPSCFARSHRSRYCESNPG